MNIFSDKTKKEVFTIALRECVERRERKDLRELFDSNEELLFEGYDYKKMRGDIRCSYPAVFLKTEDDGYVVVFPDFGCLATE